MTALRGTSLFCLALVVAARATPRHPRLRSPLRAQQASRRKLVQDSATLAVSALGAAKPLPVSADDKFKVTQTVSQADLVRNLDQAPQRRILITGANSGVGFAAAKLLVAAGHVVTLACRTQQKADAAAAACREFAASNLLRPGGRAIGRQCDLTSFDSIQNFAKLVGAEALDTLVLNAGLSFGTGDSEPHRTAEGFETTIGTNHFGHFLLASLLLKSLENGKEPRLVITASGVHDARTGDPGPQATLGNFEGIVSRGRAADMIDGGDYSAQKAYKDSKLCNVLFMEEAARRLAGKVTVNAFSPGFIPNPDGFFRYQSKPAALLLQKFAGLVGFSETNEFGGAALSYLATDPSVKNANGLWFDAYPPGKHQLAVHDVSPEAADEEKQRRLWDLSVLLTGNQGGFSSRV